MSLNTALLVLAIVCFMVATFDPRGRINALALGLALWVLSLVLAR